MSGLGDVVHALNALALLRRERPGAHIAWLVEDRFADLLRGHPHIDDLISVPRRQWGRMLRRPLRLTSLVERMRQVAARLREGQYRVSIDFQSSLKSAWIVWSADAGIRIGFGAGVNREFNYLVQNARVRVQSGRLHRIERDIALLAPLGIEPRYAEPLIPTDEGHARMAASTVTSLSGDGPLIVVHPGTSGFAEFKRWLPDRYARVADRLVRERKARILVTWGPGESSLAESVVRPMQERGMVSPPTNALGELCELLRRADLFIGGDTGPMHIASALGVPVVALFGPKDPLQTGPYCSRSVVVTGQATCRPCTRRRCPHVRCMTSITTDQVTEAALQVLDGGGERRADKARMEIDYEIKGPFAGKRASERSRSRV